MNPNNDAQRNWYDTWEELWPDQERKIRTILRENLKVPGPVVYHGVRAIRKQAQECFKKGYVPGTAEQYLERITLNELWRWYVWDMLDVIADVTRQQAEESQSQNRGEE